jgi:hypothetical protein
VKEFLWLIPILIPIALVLGGCRAETSREIVRESSRSFGKLLLWGIVLGVALEVVLYAVHQVM